MVNNYNNIINNDKKKTKEQQNNKSNANTLKNIIIPRVYPKQP